jgi:hypothetical protein
MSCAACGNAIALPLAGCPSCQAAPVDGAAGETRAVDVVSAAGAAPSEAIPEAAEPQALPQPVGPEGIGGWLVLPAIGIVVLPVTRLMTVLKDILPALMPGSWAVLTETGAEAYHPLWAPGVVFELAMNTVVIVASIVVAGAFFQRRAHAPRWMIALFLFVLGVDVCDYLIARSIPALSANAGTEVQMLKGGVQTAIWVAYFMKSVRVRNTFVR